MSLFYIDKALASARRREFRVGYYRGELAGRELAQSRRSDFAWVFEMLRLMRSHQVMTCFGQAGIDFLTLCRWTFACRRSRRDNHLLPIGAGEMPVQMISPRRQAKGKYTYLPRPDTSPVELAELIVEHHPALLAA